MSASAENGVKTRASVHPSKLPWLRWSFDAWMTDRGLRLCSVITRGVWIDLLAVAARGAEPGYLSHMGRALTVRELSQHTNIRQKTIERALEELEANGVFSRDERDVIFSRRMAHDFRDYTQAVIDGRKGGNKALMGGGDGSDGGGQNPEAERGENAEEARAQRGENAQVPSRDRAELKETSNNNAVTADRVNPPVKADKDSESEEESKKDSDPIGSAAQATPKELLRTEGVAAIVRLLAVQHGPALGLIGTMLARTGNDHQAVLDAIRRCEAELPIEPRSWLMGAVGGGARRGEGGEVVPYRPKQPPRRPARNGAVEMFIQAREGGAVISPTLDDLPVMEAGRG